MGLLSRTKGKQFERKIATAYRAAFPGRVVRRALQSQRAYESDVFIEGVPLWTECTSGRNPNPAKKMKQALRDMGGRTSTPVVVWHRLASPHIHVTLHLRDLVGFLGRSWDVALVPADLLVTISFADFVRLAAEFWPDHQHE